MNLIEKLGLEKCKQIVDGAPKGATGYSTQSNDYFYGQKWINSTEYLLCDLRTELADHDRTDHCSDIQNHISPNTKVIEHE